MQILQMTIADAYGVARLDRHSVPALGIGGGLVGDDLGGACGEAGRGALGSAARLGLRAR